MGVPVQDPFASQISDTAFLVTESRRRSVRVSRDVYAEHWVPVERAEAVRKLWDDFAREVYPHDDLTVAVRHRVFLAELSHFAARFPGAAFVNIGAGFTSYPFLLCQPVATIEIDLPHVVAFKRQRMERLVHQGVLPAREVSFVGADMTRADGQAMLAEVLAHHSERPLFVLMEGLSYYLSRPVLCALLATIGAAQRPDDILALDFWRPSIAQHPVFARLQDFFARRFGHSAGSYCLIDTDFLGGFADYALAQLSDVSAEEERFAGTGQLADRTKILEENYAILRRNERAEASACVCPGEPAVHEERAMR